MFKPSLPFLASSHEALASNLLGSGKALFKQLWAPFQVNEAAHRQFNMLFGKASFPYEQLKAWEKMNEPALQALDAFFTRLLNEPCSEGDYARALDVLRTFNCTTLHQYLELYMKTEVLLLGDIFDEFRVVCMRNNGMDPAPQLTCTALDLGRQALRNKLHAGPNLVSGNVFNG